MAKLFPFLYYSQSYPDRSRRYLAAFKKDDYEKILIGSPTYFIIDEVPYAYLIVIHNEADFFLIRLEVCDYITQQSVNVRIYYKFAVSHNQLQRSQIF